MSTTLKARLDPLYEGPACSRPPPYESSAQVNKITGFGHVCHMKTRLGPVIADWDPPLQGRCLLSESPAGDRGLNARLGLPYESLDG